MMMDKPLKDRLKLRRSSTLDAFNLIDEIMARRGMGEQPPYELGENAAWEAWQNVYDEIREGLVRFCSGAYDGWNNDTTYSLNLDWYDPNDAADAANAAVFEAAKGILAELGLDYATDNVMLRVSW